jgi:hypothetical protein
VYVDDVETTLDVAGAEEWEQTSPELTYIHDTLMTAMRELQDSRDDAPQ